MIDKETEELLSQLKAMVLQRQRLNYSAAPGTPAEKRSAERDMLEMAKLIVGRYTDVVRCFIPDLELDNHNSVKNALFEALGFVEADVHVGRQLSEVLVSFYQFLEARAEKSVAP